MRDGMLIPSVYTKGSVPRVPQDESSLNTALSERADLRAVGIVRFGTFAPAFTFGPALVATLLRIVSRNTTAVAATSDLSRIYADRHAGVAVLVPRIRNAPRTAAHLRFVARASLLFFLHLICRLVPDLDPARRYCILCKESGENRENTV